MKLSVFGAAQSSPKCFSFCQHWVKLSKFISIEILFSKIMSQVLVLKLQTTVVS